MEIALLIKSIIGLIVVLAFLVILLFLPFNKQKEKPQEKPKTASKQQPLDTDLESLRLIIKNKKTSSKELKDALNLVIKYHGTVHKKLGLRPHPDFDRYMDILFTMCRHPNATKEVVLNFDKALGELNPDYKKEINEAITKGLNSRRV